MLLARDAMKTRRVWSGFIPLALLLSVACGGLATRPALTVTVTATVPPATDVPTTTQEVPTPTAVDDLGKLAYVQGGDIWVRRLPDGEPKRLTTDGLSQEPRWSPSGEWLAFRKSDSQVWVVRADGSEAHPVDEGADVPIFAWAPATDRLAYVTDGGGLRAVNADGAYPATLVLSEPGRSAMGRVAWSPDEVWIAYEWWEQQPEQPPYQGLWRISADGCERGELYTSGVPEKGEAVLAGWSGDGRFLLFWQGPIPSASMLADGVPLYALPVAGGTPVQLAEAALLHPDFVALDPTGADRIAVVDGSYRSTWTNKVLYVVQGSSGERAAVTSPEVAVSSLAWSPDGRRIAYVAMSDEGELVGGDPARQGLMERRIWVTGVEDGSLARLLTDDSTYRDEYPLWSADGGHILFVRMDGDDNVSLWLVPAEGGDPRLVVDGLEIVGWPWPPSDAWFGYYGHIDWQPLFDWWR